jgi:hypothetical protein
MGRGTKQIKPSYRVVEDAARTPSIHEQSPRHWFWSELYHHQDEQLLLSSSHLMPQLPNWFWQYHASVVFTWQS